MKERKCVDCGAETMHKLSHYCKECFESVLSKKLREEDDE